MPPRVFESPVFRSYPEIASWQAVAFEPSRDLFLSSRNRTASRAKRTHADEQQNPKI